MKKQFRILISLLCISLASHGQRNVILIIADDLGSDYCGFYENHLDTCKMPNIRKLLAKGLRFRNAWSNPLCSPTRAGILTGRYSFRTGIGNAVGGQTSTVLDTAEKTIPKLLNAWKPNGIAKANIGKWHLNLPMPVSNYFIPNRIGYDHFEGNFTGVLSSYTSWTKVTNGIAATTSNYATSETANNAINWMKNQPTNKPFFIWMAFNAPHTPIHLPPGNLHSYSTLSGTAADITANPKPYFKAMVEALDHEIGRVFDSLKVMQRYDSTDIIFIGDNGNGAESSQVTGGGKGSIYQEGVGVPFIISGPSVINPNRASNALVNTQDLFATILELFGNTNWPSQIPANKPVDSKSIMPILKNQSDSIRPWAFTEVFKIPTVGGDGKAMRNKNYKLLDFDNGTQKFYKISTDPTEDQNLLLSNPTGIALENYISLCNQMTILVGLPRFCDIPSANDEQENPNDEVLPFPNPFETELLLPESTIGSNYQILNIQSKPIHYGKINHSNLNLSLLQPGFYQMVITFHNGNRKIMRLIKK
jgi:arylsulfatase A-like enzyme